MSADLFLHILEGATEDDVAALKKHTLGSRYFNPFEEFNYDSYYAATVRIYSTPHIFIGQVSWLAAWVSDDPASFIPSACSRVEDIVGDQLLVIDDTLIDRIQTALNLPNVTQYRVTESPPVIEFLNQHRGRRAFTVSW
ncbi:MAG TPA: hypothetical protein VHO69_03515 [Phototrophicaceae bacterium]|nr:hypothetical protein [Phototrophicaceae bacterium]